MKKLIIGLVIGLMLGMATNAFAAIGDVVSATFAQFSYVVNGETKTLDDPVLVYDGMSYVRSTQIGNMLGYDVTYKSDSRTISFNGVQTSTPSFTPTTVTTMKAPPTTVTGITYATSPPTPNMNVTQMSTAPPNQTPTPSFTPIASPIPAPTNIAQCTNIKNNYAYQIAYTKYYDPTAGSDAVQRNKVLVLEYNRDQELSAASCN